MRQTRRIIWGIFLVMLGALLLAERFGGLHVPIGSLWPLILFASAASRFAAGRIAAGVMMALLGAIFLACSMRWFGFSYAHSWPLLMVAVGTSIVVRAFTEPERYYRHIVEVPHV
jgi:hypothetical protein